jgi:hypothetical protein
MRPIRHVHAASCRSLAVLRELENGWLCCV